MNILKQFQKIIFYLLKLDKGNMSPSEYEARPKQIIYSNIINKISLNLSILISLYLLISNFKKFLIINLRFIICVY